MAANTFFVILPSNAATNPSNKSSKFKVQLPRKLHFGGQGWMVGLASIIYPNSWATVGTIDRQYLIVHLLDGTKFRLFVPRGSYLSPEQLERAMHSGALTEFARLLKIPSSRSKREAGTLEVPQYPHGLAQDEWHWIAGKRPSSGATSPSLTDAEQAMVNKVRITQNALRTRPISAEERAKLVQWRKGRREAQPERATLLLDDVYFIAQLRERQTSPPPPPPPPTQQQPIDAATGKRIEDLAPWPLHGWMRLHAGRDPHPRLRHLLDKDDITYELTLQEYLRQNKLSLVAKHILDHIEEHIEEFEALYQKIKFGENYESQSNEHKSALLEIARAIRFSWDDNIGRFILHLYDTALEKVAYITLSDQIGHVLGFEEGERITNEGQAKYAPDLHGGVSHLCVYMNSGLIESVIMGDHYAHLLQIIAVEGAPGAVVQKDFLPPIFHKIVAQETDTLDIEIRTLSGRYSLLLHFYHFSKSFL